MNLPATPACQLVPQASMLIFFAALNSASLISISSRKICPVSCEIRPRVVSRTARGCSYLLKHEMLKPTLLGLNWVPCDVLDFAFHGLSGEVGYLYAFGGED